MKGVELSTVCIINSLLLNIYIYKYLMRYRELQGSSWHEEEEIRTYLQDCRTLRELKSSEKSLKEEGSLKKYWIRKINWSAVQKGRGRQMSMKPHIQSLALLSQTETALKEMEKSVSIWRNRSMKRVVQKEPFRFSLFIKSLWSSRKIRKELFESGNHDSSFLNTSLLSLLATPFKGPTQTTCIFVFTLFLYNVLVCLHQVFLMRMDNTIMQTVNVMPVITSRITVPPNLCSNTVQVSVSAQKWTPNYTLQMSLVGNYNNES